MNDLTTPLLPRSPSIIKKEAEESKIEVPFVKGRQETIQMSMANTLWPIGASNARFLYKNKVICYLAYDFSSKFISIIAEDATVAIIDTIDPRDVIGAELIGDDSQGALERRELLHIYSYPPSCNRTRCCCTNISSTTIHRRCKRHYKLVVVSYSKEDVAAALQGIRTVAKLPPNTRKMWLVMNPFAGTGKAHHIFKTVVQPMWQEAGIQYDVYETTDAGHAKERVRLQEDLATTFTSIVAMGGDGILSEIMQGIHQRPDSQEILERISFGIIGTGTCNGLMKSILHASREPYGVLEMTFLICKGTVTPMDLSTYQTSSNGSSTLIGFLSYSYALIADLDIESEILRCLGPLRMDLWAAWRILALRTYNVRLSYLSPPTKGREDIEKASSTLLLSDPIPSDWQVIEDEVINIWACQTSHTSYNVFSSPSSTLADGLFYIIFIRSSCTRYNLLKFLLQLESGTHIHVDGVEIIPCVAFRIEPIREEGEINWRSFNDVDGEVVEHGPIQAVVNPSAALFFANIVDSSSS